MSPRSAPAATATAGMTSEPVDAFDADVLIYAANPGHPLAPRILGLFAGHEVVPIGVGSVLLLPEVLTRPERLGDRDESARLERLLGRLELIECSGTVAQRAVLLGAAYRLRAPDAVHLATAVSAGADRFVTNNRRDFPRSIGEIDITYPEDLPAPV